MHTRLANVCVFLLATVLLAVGMVRGLHRAADYEQIAGTQSVSYRVDINAADEATLCLLPGIGGPTARKIIKDREINGSYLRPIDLERVPGIGEKTRIKIERWARFDR